MEENTYKKVFHYIQGSKEPVSPHQLSLVIKKSRVSIHSALKKLLENGDIEKHGVSPKVYYTPKGYVQIIPLELTIDTIKAIVGPILRKYPINYLGVLGLVTTRETGKGINMMISYRDKFSLLSLKAIKHALSEALGVKVDLITDQGANKYIKTSMINNLQIVYGNL